MGIELLSFVATCLSHTYDTNAIHAPGPHDYRCESIRERAYRDIPVFLVADILLAGCSEGMAGKCSAAISKSETMLLEI